MSKKPTVGVSLSTCLLVFSWLTLSIVLTSCNNTSKSSDSANSKKSDSVMVNWLSWDAPKDSINYAASQDYVRQYLDSINVVNHTHFTMVNWDVIPSSDTSRFAAKADLELRDSTTPPVPPLPGPRILFH